MHFDASLCYEFPGRKMLPCSIQCSLLSVVNDNVQLHSSVTKIQRWGFVYLPSLLYHPYLVCKRLAYHPCIFLHFFSCIHNIELLSCSAMQPVSPLPITLHPPHPSHLVCVETPVWAIVECCLQHSAPSGDVLKD